MISEKAVLARVIFAGEWPRVLDRRVTSDLFQDNGCRECFKFVQKFYTDYGAVPSVELIEENFKDLKLVYAKEPVDYYLDKMTENYVRNKGSELLLSTAKDMVKTPMAGLEKLQTGVANLALDATPTKDDVAGETVDARKAAYLKRKTIGGMDGYATPWAVLNEATMGMHRGEFYAIVARPGIGKTWMLSIFAEHAMSKSNLTVLFVSQEMSNEQIQQRLDGIQFKLPYKELRAGLLPDALEKVYFEGLENQRGDAKMIVTQDANTVSMIGSKIDQYKPDIVLVDGMYLIADEKRSSSKFEAVGNVSVAIKKLARKKNVPIIVTTQFNRGAEEVAVDKVTLASLGFSDSIGQDADVVLGLFRNKDMELNNEMRVRMLKVREAEAKDFTLRWDLHRMNFEVLQLSEDDAYLPEELDDKPISY